MASITLDSIEKSFDQTQVIHDFSLTAEEGEFLVLVGPSGCGKSTLLRLIAGLEEPDSGTIQIGDSVANDMNPGDRDVAMVFQDYALYPHMTVRENLGFGLKMRKTQKAEIDKRINEAARVLEIKDLLDRHPGKLSGGESQRVAMGRAIVRKPAAFLFDEPLSNLDAALRVQMRLEIKRLHQKLKATIVYVTHDQVEAMTLADRVAVIKDGVLQQVAEPLTVYKHPANLFVAGFLGSPPMNFVPAKLIREEGGAKAVTKEFSISVTEEFSPPADQAGKDVILGFRPEDLRLNPWDNQTGDAIQGEVELTEVTGAEVVAYVRVGENLLAAKTRPDSRITPGSLLTLYLRPGSAKLFDPETQRNLELL